MIALHNDSPLDVGLIYFDLRAKQGIEEFEDSYIHHFSSIGLPENVSRNLLTSIYVSLHQQWNQGRIWQHSSTTTP